MTNSKKIFAVLVLVALVSLVAFAVDPVEGFWVSIDEKTEKATAAWKIYEKDGILYGEIVSAVGVAPGGLATAVKESYKDFPREGVVNKMTVAGTPWIWGLKKDKTGFWSGGNIIDPNDGKMYKCKITFRPQDGKKFKEDTLEMRGEIGLGIGRSQYWVKTTEEAASSLR